MKGKAHMNYYDVIGVSPTASTKAINTAHKALAKKYHPDVNSSEDAHNKMTILNEANEVLSDAVKREDYDRKLGLNVKPKLDRVTDVNRSTKAESLQRTVNAEQRAVKAEQLRRKAEARLKADAELAQHRRDRAKQRAEEAERQQVIDSLASLAGTGSTDARFRGDAVSQVDQQHAIKVLLSLVRGDDAHLRRMAEEADHQKRIREILSLVGDAGDEVK